MPTVLTQNGISSETFFIMTRQLNTSSMTAEYDRSDISEMKGIGYQFYGLISYTTLIIFCEINHVGFLCCKTICCISKYHIRPNNRPCPHYRPPPLTFYFIFTYYRLMIFFLTVNLIFTYHCPLDDLLALVKDNKFT